MPITPPVKASYTFCFRRGSKYLGIADAQSSIEGDAINSLAPYTPDWLKKQIVQSDYEVCCLIASADENPYRNTFYTDTPDVIAAGGRIPGYLGIHGKVELFIGVEWVNGNLAQSWEHLQRCKEKHTIGSNRLPPSSRRLYYIHNGILDYVSGGIAASSARIQLPTIPLADDTASPPVLNTPKAYQWAVVGHALFTAYPVGADNTHRINWGNVWAAYTQMIVSGSASLPAPERMQRQAT